MPDILLGGISINEFLADPNGANNFDTDGDGTARGGDEFIEIVNTSATAIDISGLEFWDAGRDNWFTFPPSTVLQPGAFATVVRNVQAGGSLPTVTGDNLVFDANFASNVFNNGGDNIVLYDPANDEFVQAQYNGTTQDDPTATPPNTYLGFSPTATRIGVGENFGPDQDGLSIQRIPSGFSNSGNPTPGAANVCFAAGTLIDTPQGFVRIDQLKAGDRVSTRNSGPQAILWIFSRQISQIELLANPKFRSVVLPGVEKLRVSRHHRILVTGKIAQRMFVEDEIFVPAKDLVGCCGVELDNDARSVCYYHLLLDGHHVINANGVATESLYLGSEGLCTMSAAARRELAAIYPTLENVDTFVPPDLCRTPVTGHRARRLAQRHDKNLRELLTPF